VAQVRSWAGFDVHAVNAVAATVDARSGKLRFARVRRDYRVEIEDRRIATWRGVHITVCGGRSRAARAFGNLPNRRPNRRTPEGIGARVRSGDRGSVTHLDLGGWPRPADAQAASPIALPTRHVEADDDGLAERPDMSEHDRTL
jgi:hypothetical protein